MIEIEIYAAGVRNLEKILELDHELEAVPGLRYNHFILVAAGFKIIGK